MNHIVSSQDHISSAVKSLSGILSSDEIGRLWAKDHRSQRDANPAPQKAEEIQNLAANIKEHPELLTFMAELVNIERGALGSPGKSEDPEITKLREELNGLAGYLVHLSKNIDLPARNELPKEQRQILDMLSRQTGQVPFRPVRTTLKYTKHLAKHIWHDAKAHPVAFGGLLVASLGTLGFIHMRMGSSQTIYMDPSLIGLTDLNVGADGTVSNFVSPIDPSEYANIGPSCHDHLVLLVGETGADFAKDYLSADTWAPQHCSKLKTLAGDAQGLLQGGYDFINSRIGFLIKDPTTDLGNTLIPDSPLREGFNVAAHHTAEFIYAANTVENVVLHTIIFASAMVTTVKLGTMQTGAAKRLGQKTQDFFYRTAVNTPLNYAFGIAAGTQAYLMNNGLHPEMIWMTAGGVLAGHFAHKALRRWNANDHVKKATLSVRKDLAHFADEQRLLSDECAGDMPSPRRKKTWKDFFGKKSTIATGATAVFASADMVVTGGQTIGNVLGFLGVTIPFLAYNVPEDAALHVIFGVAGGAVGAGIAGAVRGKRAIARALSSSVNSPTL